MVGGGGAHGVTGWHGPPRRPGALWLPVCLEHVGRVWDQGAPKTLQEFKPRNDTVGLNLRRAFPVAMPGRD